MGQSYLSDPNTVEKIVATFCEGVRARSEASPTAGAAASGASSRAVVELGPGLGALTRRLAELFPGMTAVELDLRAVELLRRDVPGLDVQHLDARKLDYQALSDERCSRRLFVAGNLPYSASSDIFFSLLRFPRAVRFALLMVQKEFAARILAGPGTKEYCPLSVLVELFTRSRICFTVPPTAFYPKPKVTSAVLELDFREVADLPATDPAKLCELLRTSFHLRKKVLRHSLKPLLEPRRLALPRGWEKRRAEQITPSEFAELSRLMFPS